jgi:hypothetical protein
MADAASSQYARSVGEEREGHPWAVGFTLFAAIMMIMAGIFQALYGLVALVNDHFYVPIAGYVFKFDVTTWGWVHLVGGAIVALAGWALFSGRTWARVVGIVLAVLSAIANFLWLPYYPLWSLTVIALDVFVIWALAMHGREIST